MSDKQNKIDETLSIAKWLGYVNIYFDRVRWAYVGILHGREREIPYFDTWHQINLLLDYLPQHSCPSVVRRSTLWVFACTTDSGSQIRYINPSFKNAIYYGILEYVKDYEKRLKQSDNGTS